MGVWFGSIGSESSSTSTVHSPYKNIHFFVDIDAEKLTIIGFGQELVSNIFLVVKILHSYINKYLSSQSQPSALTGANEFCNS